MDRKRTIVVGILLASSLMLAGCKKKKPPVPAPQAQAPTVTTDVPATIPEVKVPETAPPEPASKPSATVARKPKPPRTGPKVETRKTPPATTQPPAAAEKPGGKVVVEEGSKQEPSAPPLTADNSQDLNQRLNTNQLLSAAEYNVRSITRPLSKDEQAIVQHIRGFIDQSRQAIKDGDTERAHTLAIKAHLMSDELVKK